MTTKNSTKEYVIITISVASATILLFMLDKGTKTFIDLLKPINIIAFFVYCIPTILISVLFYNLLLKKYSKTKSGILSLLTGIPTCLIIIMFLFYIKLN